MWGYKYATLPDPFLMAFPISKQVLLAFHVPQISENLSRYLCASAGSKFHLLETGFLLCVQGSSHPYYSDQLWQLRSSLLSIIMPISKDDPVPQGSFCVTSPWSCHTESFRIPIAGLSRYLFLTALPLFILCRANKKGVANTPHRGKVLPQGRSWEKCQEAWTPSGKPGKHFQWA